jgi:hypothetical protein
MSSQISGSALNEGAFFGSFLGSLVMAMKLLGFPDSTQRCVRHDQHSFRDR